jgi:hypothetical protein
MVNTTPNPVTLERVRASGVYLSGAPPVVGTITLVRESVPFTPLFLRANDGQALTTVSLAGVCPTSGGYGEIQVTLLMETDAGVFATPPLNIAFVP